MINIIIFSKDNPMRLYATMESIGVFYPDHPVVIGYCKYTNHKACEGYNLIEDMFLMEPFRVDFQCGDFSDNFDKALEYLDFEYTLFLTDRCLMTDKFNLDNVISKINVGNTIGHSLCMNEITNMHTDTIGYVNKNVLSSVDWLNGVVIKTSDIPDHHCKTFNEFRDRLFYRLNKESSKMFLSYDQKSCVCNVKEWDGVENNVMTQYFLDGHKIDIKPFYFIEGDPVNNRVIENYNLVWRE